MRNTFVRLGTIIAFILLGLFVLCVINQTAQIVSIADRVSPVLGSIVLWTLLGLYGVGLFVLVWQVVRLPKTIQQPTTTEGPEFDRYIKQIQARLRRNEMLKGHPLETVDDVAAAFELLGKKADEITRATASQIFLITAVSQNGSLDGLAVFGAQVRMVNEIAQLYYQRPTLRELVSLYTNVAVAALLARQLEEIDMSEYIQPIVTAATTSLIGVVPGMEVAGTLLVQSLLSGSTNAFLTLRVGVVARRYCGSVVTPQREAVRRAAVTEAAQMIPGIISDGGKRIKDIIGAGVKTAAGTIGRQVVDTAKEAVRGTADAMTAAKDQIASGVREVAAGSRGIFQRWREKLSRR